MAQNGSGKKITENVRKFFQLYRILKQIGEMFGIFNNQVWRILHGKRWTFVEVI